MYREIPFCKCGYEAFLTLHCKLTPQGKINPAYEVKCFSCENKTKENPTPQSAISDWRYIDVEDVG